ncbi:MAG TPA: tetratricopeptide repeat protein, partial [Candidatus Wallbacteria bacterium]|nr:tetratricopeptide repeat protein [Candidatus Wallbacteria bacterium]
MSGNELKTRVDIEAAIKFEERSLAMLLKISGKYNEKIGNLYYKIGNLYRRIENNEAAEINIKNAVEIFEKLNTINENRVNSYIYFARKAAAGNEFEKAAEIYSKALRTAASFTGKGIIHAIYVQNDAAVFYLLSMKDEAKAVELINASIVAGAALANGEKSDDLVNEIFFSFRILAEINLKKGDVEKAREYFFNYIKMFGSDLNEWCAAAEKTGNYFYDNHDFDNALFFYQNILDKLKETPAANFWGVRANYDLAKLFEAVEKYDEAVKY